MSESAIIEPADEDQPTDQLRVVMPIIEPEPEPEPVAAVIAPAPMAMSSLSPKISILGEVELKVDVVLGRARRTLQELLSLRPSQTIELDRQRNSPVEVLVNGKAFAFGEIVVIDETNLGVRIIDVLDTGLNPDGNP